MRAENTLVTLIADTLERCSKRSSFDDVGMLDNYKLRSVMLQDLVYDAIGLAPIRKLGNRIFFFTGRIYEPIVKEALYRGVEVWLRRMHIKAEDMFHSLKLLQRKAVESVELNRYLEPRFHIQAFTNGVVNFVTGEVFDFSAEYDVVYLHNYKYDVTAKCPTWMSFLKEVLPERESRHILQMYLGLCTLDRGLMTDKVENCLLLYGNGSNGKSVIFETVMGLFGKENVSTFGLMSLIRGGDERQRNLGMIDGKLVNFCPEIQAKDISGYEDAFKSLCSGENQIGRKIGGNPYMIHNVPWLIFNMNDFPRAQDGSHGYFRRMLYIIFEHVIPDYMQNKHLVDDLKKEYSGILNWVIRGARYLKQRKYIFPSSANSERQKLYTMGESNITASWCLARNIYANPRAKGENYEWISAIDMYNDLCKYAEMNGFKGLDITAFGRMLTKQGFTKTDKKRTAAGMLYRVFGCSNRDLMTEPPLVADMDLTGEDLLNAEVEYDEEDV